MVRRLASAALSAALLLIAASTARASLILYTDRSSFNAATTAQNNFNFDSLSPTNSFVYYNNSVTTNGVTFTTSNNSLFGIGRDLFGGVFSFGSANVVLQDNTQPSDLSAGLPAGTTAFAVDLGLQAADSGTTVTVDLSDGESFLFTAPNRPDLNFLGVTTDSPISSVTFSSPSFGLSFADFTTAQAVPEPTSLLLLALGVLGMAGYGVRRRQRTGASHAAARQP